MSKITKIETEKLAQMQQETEKVAIYYGKESVTYERLQKDVNGVVKQLQEFEVKKENRLFLFMDNPYLKIVTVLAANQLQCGVIPYFETVVPEFHYDEHSQYLIVVADEKSTGKLVAANISYKPVQLLTEDEAVENLLSYQKELTYGTYELSDSKHITFFEEQIEGNVTEQADACGMKEGESICINGVKDAKLYLEEIFGALMRQTCIYSLQKNLEMNPMDYLKQIAKKQIGIINLTPFVVKYFKRFKDEESFGEESIFNSIHHFILIGEETKEEVATFLAQYSEKITQYPSKVRRRDFDEELPALDMKERYILELVYQFLQDVVTVDLSELNVEDELVSWGVTSLYFVQMVVQLENILDIEFEDDVFDLASFENLLLLEKCITRQWMEMKEL
ncbi:MAG TPA: non-ribosomal peptide synthetase [Mobilitalea sp.]|nr:non-ribosomal peptide synthetase [Mobilitalea sp.]